MAITPRAGFDQEAEKLVPFFPLGPRTVIIGSTDFWHKESECTCNWIGRLLAGIPDLVLITGGVEGIGEAIGRSFFQTRCQSGLDPRVYHVLPEGEETWDYGQTLFAGSDMAERREILARLADIYVAVEGGPGTVHEAAVATSRGALVLPVGRSGGHSAELYARVPCPAVVDRESWRVLGSNGATPEEAARAVFHAVRSCLNLAT